MEKQIEMKVKELIKELSKLPQDAPIRVLNIDKLEDGENEWVVGMEEENEGNDYHSVILLTSI